MPSAADSTTVPLMAGGGPAWLASAASSWAGVRAGRTGEAAAAVVTDAAVTAATTATAPACTAREARDCRQELHGHLTLVRPGPDRTSGPGEWPRPETCICRQAMPTRP